MRAVVCAIAVATGLAAHPALAQPDTASAAFWKGVQAACDATAAKPAGDLGRRIAQTAIGEFDGFGGHQIDANGRLFRFGLTEAEHEEDDAPSGGANLSRLGWWQVMKYWRALYGDDAATKLEVRGYQDASTSAEGGQAATVLRTSAADLLKLADRVADPEEREILREAAYRTAIIDTSWSAAFISYVVKESGVGPDAFRFANAHSAYIYDAFATSAAEQTNAANEHIYRACPLSTKPRVGDIVCAHRQTDLAELSDAAVRERVRTEVAGGGPRSIRRSHCEVVAYVDAQARKMYTIGGNVNQGVTARKLNLRNGLKFSPSQKGSCGGPGNWTLPKPLAEAANGPSVAEKCSLNDKKWFVLLQVRSGVGAPSGHDSDKPISLLRQHHAPAKSQGRLKDKPVLSKQ